METPDRRLREELHKLERLEFELTEQDSLILEQMRRSPEGSVPSSQRDLLRNLFQEVRDLGIGYSLPTAEIDNPDSLRPEIRSARAKVIWEIRRINSQLNPLTVRSESIPAHAERSLNTLTPDAVREQPRVKRSKPDDGVFRTALNEYNRKEVLGEGANGRVFKVLDSEGREFALKLLRKGLLGGTKQKRFQCELNFCMATSHPNIIRVLDHGLLGEEGVPFFVMPLYESTLRKAMDRGIDSGRALQIVHQLAVAMDFAHRQEIVHRDLKPENILCDTELRNVVVADFGIAHFSSDLLVAAVETSAHERLANFTYSAPEQRMRGQTIGAPCDIWALGLIINELFTGQVPLGKNHRSISSIAPEYAQLDQIVDQMLRQTPEDRPDAGTLKSHFTTERLNEITHEGTRVFGSSSGGSFVGKAVQELEPAPSVRLLQRYYPDSDLRAYDLLRYSFSVDDRRIVTNIATSAPWLKLILPIHDTANGKFEVLDNRENPWRSVPKDEVERLHRELEARGITFKNRPIYSLRSFTPGQAPTASFSLGQYADYKIKMGRLEEETIRAASIGWAPDVPFHQRSSETPLRNELLPTSETMAKYGDRLCAGGTNILLALRTPGRDDYLFYIKQRSGRVSTGRYMLSLIPSGMHQPSTWFVTKEETSVGATAYRETDEELFGGAEPDPEDFSIGPLEFMSKPHLAWFRSNPEAFTLEIVSFGLNLVDGTFEFGVLLAVHDPSYWTAYAEGGKLVPNEEVFQKIIGDFYPRDASNLASFTTEAPFFTSDTSRLMSVITAPECADVSRIALVQGLRRLQELARGKVELPPVQVLF